jgi:hypothetical protein
METTRLQAGLANHRDLHQFKRDPTVAYRPARTIICGLSNHDRMAFSCTYEAQELTTYDTGSKMYSFLRLQPPGYTLLGVQRYKTAYILAWESAPYYVFSIAGEEDEELSWFMGAARFEP